MLGQETEADEQVRLAAAHGLLEVEHGLRRRAGEADDSFADEILHALGDVGAFEERRSITLAPDQLVKLLDLVTELDREGVGLELAHVTDGLHVIESSPLCALRCLATRSAT